MSENKKEKIQIRLLVFIIKAFQSFFIFAFFPDLERRKKERRRKESKEIN